jgi:hypothetical protein
LYFGGEQIQVRSSVQFFHHRFLIKVQMLWVHDCQAEKKNKFLFCTLPPSSHLSNNWISLVWKYKLLDISLLWYLYIIHYIILFWKRLESSLNKTQFYKSGGELLEMRLLDKKWNRSFFYLPYVYQYLT